MHFRKNCYSRFVELDARNLIKKKRLCRKLIHTPINDQNKIECFFVQKLSDEYRVRTPPLSATFCTKKHPILFWSFMNVGISFRHDLFFKNYPRAFFYKSRITVFSKMYYLVDKKSFFWKENFVFLIAQKIDNKSKNRFHKKCYWRHVQYPQHFTFSIFLSTHFFMCLDLVWAIVVV